MKEQTTMRIAETPRVADIVLEHPETLEVFEAHAIDYCCGGAKSLAAACAGRGDIDARRLIAALERAIAARPSEGATNAASDPRALSTRALIDRILARHHAYLRAALPELRTIAAKVARVHGERDPRLAAIARRVDALAGALLAHLGREEDVLFPALLDPGAPAASEVIERELTAMLAEHEEVGAALDEIRALSDGYAVPEWGCPTYRAFFAKLRELETDVHRHVHLENNVLMPRFLKT